MRLNFSPNTPTMPESPRRKKRPMICSCDICGEYKPCLFYRCFFGDTGQYNDCLHLCKDCVEIQKKEGPIQEEPPEENFSIEYI